jgi:hypothetical protein
MAIVKRPTNPITPSKTAEAFIQGAPDAAPPITDTETRQGVMLGKQRQVSFAMPPELLERVDEAARKLSLTRAGYMKMVLTQRLDADGQQH